jgi:hypothetical protein
MHNSERELSEMHNLDRELSELQWCYNKTGCINIERYNQLIEQRKKLYEPIEKEVLVPLSLAELDRFKHNEIADDKLQEAELKMKLEDKDILKLAKKVYYHNSMLDGSSSRYNSFLEYYAIEVLKL